MKWTPPVGLETGRGSSPAWSEPDGWRPVLGVAESSFGCLAIEAALAARRCGSPDVLAYPLSDDCSTLPARRREVAGSLRGV